jgi:hypothetical protein
MERLYLVLGLPPGSYMTAMESICYRPRSTDTLLEQLTPMPQWLRPAVSVGRAAMRGECSAVDTGHKAPLCPVSVCAADQSVRAVAMTLTYGVRSRRGIHTVGAG